MTNRAPTTNYTSQPNRWLFSFMATNNNIVLEVDFAWWFKWYLLGVTAMCDATGMEPHEERFGYWIGRACKFKINPA